MPLAISGTTIGRKCHESVMSIVIGVHYAKCLLVATDNDMHDIYITLSARHLSSKLFIIARSNHDKDIVRQRPIRVA